MWQYLTLFLDANIVLHFNPFVDEVILCPRKTILVAAPGTPIFMRCQFSMIGQPKKEKMTQVDRVFRLKRFKNESTQSSFYGLILV